MIELSVVIPIRNEAESLDDLYRELTAALEPWGRPYEVVVIDDGSTDESFRILAQLQAADARWRIIRFRRNFGQTAAFSAGFAHARGRYIVTSDGDLQNDPRDIPGVIERLERGNFDIVCAEIDGFVKAHKAEGTWPGGIHVELTGDDVTECIGGVDNILDSQLDDRYQTVCDPRLNGRQGLDLAFHVAEMIRTSGLA